MPKVPLPDAGRWGSRDSKPGTLLLPTLPKTGKGEQVVVEAGVGGGNKRKGPRKWCIVLIAEGKGQR